MAFGQQGGPPATHRQMQDLLELVIAAGHVDLRDARGPLGLTQRQAGGKFTREEADELIARLEAEAEAGTQPTNDADPGIDAIPPAATRASSSQRATATPVPKAPAGGAVAAARARREAEALRRVRDLPDHLLAAELQRRGWVVLEP